MDEHEFFRSVGGTTTVQAGGDPSDPGAITWNFGLVPTTPVIRFANRRPSLYEAFPNIQGKWDGKTSVNHHDAVRKVLGKDMPAQQQPRGTCGGRAGSQGLQMLQTVLIGTGKRAKYRPVSHAWLYFLARREYNMLSGGDGVAGGSIPLVMGKYGSLDREESGDTNFYGDGSDDLAAAWGGGRLRGAQLEALIKAASDNIVTAQVDVHSAAELADGIAAGGIGVGSDNQGFTMTRDAEGFCSPKGSWSHYHIRTGVRVNARGRRGFDYNQSWGNSTPDGPPLEGCPGNCFGVDWDVQDRVIKSGEWSVILGFDLWNLESGGVDIPWIFM